MLFCTPLFLLGNKMAHTYAELLTRVENGENIQIPVDELLRIYLSSKFPDGSAFDGVTTAVTGDVSITPASGAEFDVDVVSGGSIAVNPLKNDSFATIDFVHWEIHEGDHYFLSGYDTLDNLGTVEFVVETPDSDKHAHMLFQMQSEKTLTVEVFEGAASVSGGSVHAAWNSNRNSGNSSLLTVTKDPASIGSDGTLIDSYKWGSKKTGGLANRDEEIILAADETYLWRMTSGEAANIVWFRGSWYEHAE